MGVEQTVFDYHDIVPRPTWAERNVPTFLGLARRMGYFLPDQTPREYPTQMTVNMPRIPWSAREEDPHPLLSLFDLAYQAVNRMVFEPGEQRTLKLRLDRGSFLNVTNVSYLPDDSSIFGDIMNLSIALTGYAEQWFEKKGYVVTSVGIGSSPELELHLQRA